MPSPFVQVADVTGEKLIMVRPQIAAFLKQENYSIIQAVRRLPKTGEIKTISNLALSAGGFINLIEYVNGTAYAIHTPAKTIPSQIFKVIHNFKTTQTK